MNLVWRDTCMPFETKSRHCRAKWSYPRHVELNVSNGVLLPPLGVLGSSLTGYVPLALQNSYPIILYFVVKIDPILVTFGYYSMFRVYFVANYKPHLSYFWANDFLTLKVPKTCDPILDTLLKMLENTTPL